MKLAGGSNKNTGGSQKLFGAFLSKGLSYAMALAASIVISRTLGPSGRGAYFVLVTIATTAVSLGHLSVEQAQVFLWSNSNKRAALPINAVLVGVLLGLIAAAAAFAIVFLLGPDLVPITSRGLLLVALAGVPLAMVGLYVNGLLVLDDRLGRVNWASLLAATIQTAGILILARLDRLTVGAVVVMWTVTMAVPLLLTIPTIGARIREASINVARESVALGLKYHLGMLAVFLLWRSDVFVLNALVTRTEVGLYSLAVTLAELTFLLTDSVAQITLPRQVEGSLEASSEITARAVRTNFLISLIAVTGVVVSGPILIPLLFGVEFSGSMIAIVSLAPGIVALGTFRPAGGYLIRLNRPFLISGASLFALTLNVLLNLWFIPIWGIAGAGIASSIAYGFLAAFYLVWLVRSSGLTSRSLIPRKADVTAPISMLLARGRTSSKG